MSELVAMGLAASLSDGWEGEIYRRGDSGWSAETAARLSSAGGVPVATGAFYPAILHLATFPLPSQRGDYGGGALSLMGVRDIFAALFEHDPASAATALFRNEGPPWPLRAQDFDPSNLRVALPGQTAAQWFFRIGGRPFALYAVLGSHALRSLLVGVLNDTLQSVRFD